MVCSKCQRIDIKCCTTCKKDADKCGALHRCGSDCPEHERRIINNADRIRNMSDSDLAHFLEDIDKFWNDGECCIRINGCVAVDDYTSILEWLQAE